MSTHFAIPGWEVTQAWRCPSTTFLELLGWPSHWLEHQAMCRMALAALEFGKFKDSDFAPSLVTDRPPPPVLPEQAGTSAPLEVSPVHAGTSASSAVPPVQSEFSPETVSPETDGLMKPALMVVPFTFATIVSQMGNCEYLMLWNNQFVFFWWCYEIVRAYISLWDWQRCYIVVYLFFYFSKLTQ